mgnify:FL=1
MEVTPEMYAWLTDLNIINPFSSLKTPTEGNFILPEKTMELMIGGKYMDIILNTLQFAYNKFYKLKLDYLSGLSDLKEISEDQTYISNSVKYANWHLINDILNKFGISYTEDQINQLINGDKEFLLKVITQIFYLCNQFLKDRTFKSDQKEKSVLTKDKIKEKEKDKEKDKESNINDRSIISELENEIDTKKVTNKNITSTQKNNDTVNINSIDPTKHYNDCNTALEFFILSLCKNFNMKPRQAVALLSNNRKYLSIICNKGLKGDFNKIKQWLYDLNSNCDIMLKMINTSEDGLNISYSTIGTALICNENDIPVQCAELLNKINLNTSMNWDWLKNEGLDLILFAIIKTEDERDKLTLLNILYDFIKTDTKEFYLELNKKLASNQNKIIIEFLFCILPLCHDLNKTFYNELKDFIFDLCLNSKNDLSTFISLLCDAFFYFNPAGEELIEKIMNFFKSCLKSDVKIVYSYAIVQIISLMDKFGKNKNKYGPQLYKCLVNMFIEGYNNEEKREFFLINFEKFFNSEQQVPIDIFLEKYINKLNSVDNYILSDFEFLSKILEHPRVESKYYLLIIKFIVSVCLKNVNYNKVANYILALIFQKELIKNRCSLEDSQNISQILESYINNAMNEYMKDIKSKKKKQKRKEENNLILETPYDILSTDIFNMNQKIFDNLLKNIKEYRKMKSHNSTALLYLLSFNPERDDILMNLEEEFRPIYDSAEEAMNKKKKEEKELEKKDYGKQIQNYFEDIRLKKKSQIEDFKFKEIEIKKREEKIKKKLVENRKIEKIMSGKDNLITPEAIYTEVNLAFESQKTQEDNNYTQNSNLLQAINSATEKYINKGNLSTDVNLSNNYMKNRNKIMMKKYKLTEEKKKDDVFNKFGRIESIETKKRKEEAMKIYKERLKMQLIQNFVFPEGSLINIGLDGKQEIADTHTARKYSIYMTKNRSKFNPTNLEDEEDREIKAIDGYNYEYRKNIKFYFRFYANEVDQVISKRNLLKLLRDKGITSKKLDLEEFNSLIRYLFNENLTEFTFDQYSNLLIHLSNLIFTKIRPTLTLGECYGNLLKKLTLQSETEMTVKKKNMMQPVIELLLDKKKNKEDFNLPEGFKFTVKTTVKYNNRLPPHFVDIIGEGAFICYELVEEIIFDIFNSSIIEPFVKLNAEEDVIVEPDKLHKWTPEVTKCYIEMGRDYKQYGMIACDALEDGFKNYFKGKNIKGEAIIHPQEKKLYEAMKLRLKRENKQSKLFIERKREIESKLEAYKKKKKEERKEKLKQMKLLREQRLEENKLIQEKFSKVQEKQKQQYDEKISKLVERQNKIKEKNDKRDKELIEFYHKQKKKIKSQMNEILEKRKEYLNKFKEKDKEKNEQNKPKINPRPSYIDKDKEYIDFDNKLIETMDNLRKREDINAIFEKYSKHLKTIYDIYSRIGNNKISFYSKDCIKINEFKQFLINFAVLGLLISTDQMNWIFNKISKSNLDKKERQSYLDYDDFQITLILLAIFSRFTERSRKILPSDLNSTNGETVEYFFKFLGLKIPYNKLEMENFINDRRALTMKNLLDLQRKIKTNVSEYKDGKYKDVEEEKKKEEKKKIMKQQRDKKEKEREKEDKEDKEEKEDKDDEEANEEEEEDENEGNNDK